MSHPNGPQPPVPPQGQPSQGQPPQGQPPQGQPPQGQPPHGQPPHGQSPQGPPPPPYGPPPGWGPPPQGPPPQGPPAQGPPTLQWGAQGPGGYPQQPAYGAPQWSPTPPQGGNGSNRSRNIVLVVVGAVVALALVVAAVVVGINVLDDGSGDSESSSSTEAGGDDEKGTDGGDDGSDGDGAGDPMSEGTVTDLTAALEADESWSCYTTVAGSLVRCHSFVAGEDPQRATLRISLADGAVTDVDLAAYLVDDPAAITEVAAKAVGDTLFDGKGAALVAAAAADTNLGPEDLGADATFTAYGDGFQVRAEGTDVAPAAGPSPKDTATLTPTLTAKGFTCKKDEADSVSCEKNDGKTGVRVLGIDHDTSSSWNVSVRGASYDTPVDETQARAVLGQELVGLGLTDESGASWLGSAADRQEGDFSGYSTEVGIYTSGSDAYVSASVRQVR
ncbi:hypothetical protein [Mumia sp. DW29H23]|uniref:hypothetical protein n=1 Tax=Mumia sp. DW29H23 TaxID=3421241 RepID=UPI003D68A8B0